MDLKDFSPSVRYVGYVKNAVDYTDYLCAYDYRLIYVIKNTLTVRFGECDYELAVNDMLVFPPAIPYKLLFEQGGEAEYYIVNFDFDSNGFYKKPNPPKPLSLFNINDVFSFKAISPYENITYIKDAVYADSLLSDMYAQSKTDSALSLSLMSSLMKTCLLKALRPCRPENELVRKLKKYINENFEKELTNSSIAKHFGYHSYYLNSLFVKFEGITLHKYLTDVRIAYAKELLLRSNKTAFEIAEKCGFNGASYFSEAFSKTVGMSPKKYRDLSK